MADRSARLCIVSREPFRSGHFVAALHASLGRGDHLEIIVDRRHAGSPGLPALREDRRRQPQVDAAVEANGFAIVPASVERLENRVLPPLPSRLPFEVPSGHRSRADDDQQRLELARSFLRRRRGELITTRLRVLSAAVIVLGVFAAAQLIGPSRLGELFMTTILGGPDRPSGPPSGGLAREEPVVSVTSPAPSARPDSPRDADRIVPKPEEPRVASEPGPSPRDARVPLPEGSPASSPVAAPPKATPAKPAGSYRAELVGQPVSRGWGDSYAVRLLDSAGRPVVEARVLLVARMADGTVENVAMGALAEPGTFRGTVPTARSTPVDLRVRVTTSGGSVEVPVSR
jgi:hypothetical protein